MYEDKGGSCNGTVVGAELVVALWLVLVEEGAVWSSVALSRGGAPFGRTGTKVKPVVASEWLSS